MSTKDIKRPYRGDFTGEQIDAILHSVKDKVDKEEGKGLSSNDFTDEYKQKLDEVGGKRPYLSLERLRRYLYRVTFDSLPRDNGGDSPVVGGCSSFVKDGRLFRNLDYNYDNAASFIVRTREFEGMSFVTGLNDGFMKDDLIAQLPYRVVDGRNNHGIMVSTHLLFNDWNWTGCGEKCIPLTRLPFLVLSKVKSMATLPLDLEHILSNLTAGSALGFLGYLLQILVTDGITTYALLPPTEEGGDYVIKNITSNPKLTNFRWVASETVRRIDLQLRPTGIERWNAMPCSLEELRFTKAYEEPDRLSEFIGMRGTTKFTTDEELMSIYQTAKALYRERHRDGQTWHTMHSVIYGGRMESLFIQENWQDNCVGYESHSCSGVVEHGTKEYWDSRLGYIPAEGTIIVYDNYKTIIKDGETVLVPAIKVGTGNGYVQDLAFVGEAEARDIEMHIADTAMHVTDEEREYWNNKISVDDYHEVVEETLEFIK